MWRLTVTTKFDFAQVREQLSERKLAGFVRSSSDGHQEVDGGSERHVRDFARASSSKRGIVKSGDAN